MALAAVVHLVETTKVTFISVYEVKSRTSFHENLICPGFVNGRNTKKATSDRMPAIARPSSGMYFINTPPVLHKTAAKTTANVPENLFILETTFDSR